MAAVVWGSLVAGACGGGGAERPSLDAGASTTTTTKAPSISLDAGAGGASTSTTTTVATTGTTASAGKAGSAGTGNAGTGNAAAATADPAAGARASLDAYLHGLAAQDASATLAHSTGAAAAVANIRFLIAAINATAGGTTTAQVSSASFNATTASPTSVVFAGSASLDTDVQGSHGHQHTTATVDGPVTVEQIDGAWRVRTFDYDGQSMQLIAENATQATDGIHLTVGYLLSYAGVTNAVVGLSVDSGHVDLALQSAALVTSGGGGSATGGGFVGGPPRGYLGFARATVAPTELDATFKRADGTVVSFAIPLRGAPS